MKYFDSFPSVQYKGVMAKNLMLGIRVIPEVLQKWNLAYPYVITDNDTITSIAHQYYGSKDFAWLVLLSAQIVDPYYDWPLDSEAFENYISQKYGSKQEALTTVYGYIRDRFSPVVSSQLDGDFDQYIRNKYGLPPGDPNGITVATSTPAYYVNTQATKVSPEQWQLLPSNQQTQYQPVSLYTYERELYEVAAAEESQRLSEYIMTPFTYQNTDPLNRIGYRPLYAYDFEFRANERKRSIRLINRRYTTQIGMELKEKLNSVTRTA
jgi:hypothetical protein